MLAAETRWPCVDAGSCRLRPARADDLAALQAAAGDPRFPSHLPLARMAREGGLAAWLDGLVAGAGVTRLWAITEMQEDACIGQIGLLPMPEVAGHWVSYWLTPDWQGKGIAGTALAALTDAALAQPGYGQLVALIAPGNLPSIAAALRGGFTKAPDHNPTVVSATGFDAYVRQRAMPQGGSPLHAP